MNLKNKILNLGLKSQLVLVVLSSVIVSFFFLLSIMNPLLNRYQEKNIYNMLRQSLPYLTKDSSIENDNVAFLVIDNFNYAVSRNFTKIVGEYNIDDLISKIVNNQGKFNYAGKMVYYTSINNTNTQIVTLTNDSLSKRDNKELTVIIYPLFMIILVLSMSSLFLYSSFLVKKITIIKDKIKHIDDKKYNHYITFMQHDELREVVTSISETKNMLEAKEQAKNNMFQSISHELKTPLTVMTNYLEAYEDNNIKISELVNIFKEETIALHKEVELLLCLNKINYLNSSSIDLEEVNIKEMILKKISNINMLNQNIKIEFLFDDDCLVIGKEELWLNVINNIFSNFERYVKSYIKINLTKEMITFYNDGALIDEELLEKMFLPYQKGKDGIHGLGLYIVKETLNLMGYDILAKNLAEGVEFIIKKRQ